MQTRGSNGLLALFFFLTGCATIAPPLLPPGVTAIEPSEAAKPYSVLVARDPLHHFLVDDFRARQRTNRTGGLWTEQAPEGGSVMFEFLSEDAFKPQGASLKIIADIPAASEGRVTADLNQLDISQAKAFSFWIKADRSIRNFLFAEIENGFGERAEISLAPFFPRKDKGDEWTEVLIGPETLAAIRLYDLRKVALIVRSGNKPAVGNMLVDHVVFSGEHNVRLKSLADNLYGFSDEIKTEERRQSIARLYDQRMLSEIAKDTWGYFRDLVDRQTKLPVDHVKLDPPARIGDYTSPTNVALYFTACMAARDFRWISAHDAETRVRETLETLEKLPHWEGLFFNFYSTTNLQVTRRFVSSVDNAWLAASLVAVRQAFPELSEKASALLDRMDFGKLYSESVGHFFVGYDAEKGSFQNNHYGLLSSETRILSYVAIGKGDVSEDHWYRLYRTLPPDWDWQNQIPRGETVDLNGHQVFEGFYMYHGIPVVPSWGGGLFEFLMPTLFVDETKLAPRNLGLNNRNAVRAQILYARDEQKYSVWGLSPCVTDQGTQGAYREYGLGDIGSKGYRDEGVITPHVSFLALLAEPEEAVKNIRALVENFSLYGPYGLYDSIHLKRSVVCHQYLALDQGMTLAALANYLNKGSLQNYFHADPVGARMDAILAAEEFYPGFVHAEAASLTKDGT